MYRRLIVFGLAVCATALIAMMVPLIVSASDSVRIEAVARGADHARSVALAWQEEARAQLRRDPHLDEDDLTSHLDLDDGPGDVTLVGPDGLVAGPAPTPAATAVVRTAEAGTAATAIVDGTGYAATPVLMGDHRGIVLVTMTPADLRKGLGARLAGYLLASLFLLSCAAIAAWLLARRTVTPLLDLTDTANRVADGDLSARASTSSVSEIQGVGVALNRLTVRVAELLAEQRSETAELAHQLRTPLTVLSVDLDGVDDPTVRDRLRDDLDSVQRMVDEIITTVRRPTREGLYAQCDACTVVRERVSFWGVLAEDQNRRLTVDIPSLPAPVRATADDLAAGVDILLQNVFLHTPEGAGFAVAVRPAARIVDVVVQDDGPGLPPANGDRPAGSTGLGLSIARRLAQASGGDLILGRSPSGGFEAVLRLGVPAT